MYVILLLIFLFLIGSPFVLIYRWLSKSNSKTSSKAIFNPENSEMNFQFNNQSDEVKYTFMKDYRMWKNLSEKEKEERLKDIEVIFQEGKNSIKKEMINQGFLPGSKIIDIKYFTGLSEHGFTITGFLIQNEAGGEIRELVINIDLAKMEFTTTRNSYHSSGKERYYYLKNRKGLVEI